MQSSTNIPRFADESRFFDGGVRHLLLLFLLFHPPLLFGLRLGAESVVRVQARPFLRLPRPYALGRLHGRRYQASCCCCFVVVFVVVVVVVVVVFIVVVAVVAAAAAVVVVTRESTGCFAHFAF